MDNNIFDGIGYFSRIANLNKYMQDNQWHVGTMNMQRGIEPVMQEFRTQGNFFLIDDAPMGSISMNSAGGFFDNRTYVCHFVSRVNERDGLQVYESKMNIVRELFRQFMERIIVDATQLRDLHQVYVQTSRIYYKEPGKAAYGGAAGLYFQVTISQPQSLVYRQGNWIE